MRVFVFMVTATLLSASATSVATAAAPTPVPEMQANWAPFMFQVGTWVCHGNIASRPGDRLETDVNSMDFDNHWMVTRFDSPPFDKNRTKHSIGVNYLSYDPTNKLWYAYGADNFGGSLGYSTSPGWNGDTITFTFYTLKNGALMNMGRNTTTKISATEIRNKSWDEKGDVTFTDDCKKQ